MYRYSYAQAGLDHCGGRCVFIRVWFVLAFYFWWWVDMTNLIKTHAFLFPVSCSQEVDVSVPAAGLMFALLAHYQVIFRLSRVDDDKGQEKEDNEKMV